MTRKTTGERLARIETLLEQLVKKEDDKDQRLRKVENRQSYWAGASSFVGLLIGAALTYFAATLRGQS